MSVQNSLTTKPKQDVETIQMSAFLTQDAIRNRIDKMIGGKDGNRFISSIVSAVSTNPKLAECTNTTIFNAALLGESLRLSPSPQLGHFYLVPFDNKRQINGQWKKIKEAQFILGYKGYIQLAIRSGQYRKINVIAVKETELKKYDRLEGEIELTPIVNEIDWENAKTIGYYAMFELSNGFRKGLYWPIEKMEAHADKYSTAFNLEAYKKLQAGETLADMWKYSSFWYTDFDGQAYKTMIRQLISKWGIMSIDLQNAMDKDMAVIDDAGKAQYVDNQPNVIDIPSAPAQITAEDDPFADKTPQSDFASEIELEALEKKIGKEAFLKLLKENNNQVSLNTYYDLMNS